MFIDIVIPKGNEEQFIQIAKELGTEKLLFLYNEKPKEIKGHFSGQIVTKNPGHKAIFFSKGSRGLVENRNVKFHYGFEELEKKDSLHHRRSGMNQVISKLMSEREKTMIIDFEKYLQGPKEIYIGRLHQNLKLAKKYGFQIAIASFATKPQNLRAANELKHLIKSLGYHDLAKKSVQTLSQALEE